MSSIVQSLRPHWPIAAFAVSAALLASAHAFETFGGLKPCMLCLNQREYHWGILALAAACFVVLRMRPAWARGAAGAIGAAFLASTAMAGYHVAVEQHWVIAQCEAKIDLSAIRPLGADSSIEAPQCDVIAWSLFGISMAGYNMLISLMMAAASFVVALAKDRKA